MTSMGVAMIVLYWPVLLPQSLILCNAGIRLRLQRWALHIVLKPSLSRWEYLFYLPLLNLALVSKLFLPLHEIQVVPSIDPAFFAVSISSVWNVRLEI